MPKEEWVPWNGQSQLPPKLGPNDYTLDVCPGYIARLPMVNEVASAWKAFEKGNWESFYPDAPNYLCEGVLILDNAVIVHRNWVREQQELKAKSQAAQGNG